MPNPLLIASLCWPLPYYHVLLEFMNFHDGNVHEDGHIFTDEELAPICPKGLQRWMEVKAFA